jgi:hypothetical protein
MISVLAILAIILLTNFTEGFLQRDILWLRLMPFVAVMFNSFVEPISNIIANQPIESLSMCYISLFLCGFLGLLIICHFYIIQNQKQEENENV